MIRPQQKRRGCVFFDFPSQNAIQIAPAHLTKNLVILHHFHIKLFMHDSTTIMQSTIIQIRNIHSFTFI